MRTRIEAVKEARALLIDALLCNNPLESRENVVKAKNLLTEVTVSYDLQKASQATKKSGESK